MSHRIEALVFPATAMSQVATRTGGTACVTELNQGFCLLPITRELALWPPTSSDDDEYDDRWDDQPEEMHVTLAREISLSYPVASVWTDYFGGSGSQGATVWFPRDRLPQGHEWGLGFAFHGHDPINQALRAMGVVVNNRTADEFESVGLHWFRSNEDWAERGKRSPRDASLLAFLTERLARRG